MGGFSVGGGEFVGKGLGADAIDGDGEVGVGDGRVASFDGPKRLRQSAHRRRRVKHDLRSVHPVHHPVLSKGGMPRNGYLR